MKQRIVAQSIAHRRLLFAVITVFTVGLGAFIPFAKTDTDPENMLAEDQPARVLNDETKERFGLYDILVVGVVDEHATEGVFTPQTLGRVAELTDAIKRIDGVIQTEVLSLSTIDNVRTDGVGTVRFEWLLEGAPESQEQATGIFESARRLPMVDGSMVSEDGQALLIYVPVVDKSESHRVSQEIEGHIEELIGDGQETFITGLPVAEDTFGVQMFIQMAISAPLAGLVIFLVMGWFFRSVRLITAPMAVAMATVVITMGLLIALGFEVHIMSSMIAIFLMPIAVVDSVHVLSEFSDLYDESRSAKEVIEEVMDHLFTPMLYTSLTSAAGFFSLLVTPIPPVQIFGAFVGFGILLAFLLTVTFVPAFVSGVSADNLKRMAAAAATDDDSSLLARFIRRQGQWIDKNTKLILAGTAVAIGVSAWGISLIEINDNPVRWFRPSHELRVADRTLNEHFAGTYPAYLVLDAPEESAEDAALAATTGALADLDGDVDGIEARVRDLAAAIGVEDSDAWFSELVDGLYTELDAAEGDEADGWDEVVRAVEEAQIAFKTFQSPEVLDWIVSAQDELEGMDVVGNTIALPDVVRTVYRELLGGDEENFRIPERSRGVAQAIVSFQSSHRPDDLWHFVTTDYRAANVWVQLKSGDNQDMTRVERTFDEWIAANPPPAGVTAEWSGPTHLNRVWQQEMVAGMGWSLLSAFGVVFVMMTLLFRSALFGFLAMLPLSLTMAIIYGATGILGKDYDMPVAVLSSLTLGLSVDFAIHLLQRVRAVYAETGDWKATHRILFEEPARAITRNALVIAIGFLPLLAAPLVPYNTVGILMAAIMIVSGGVTLVLLPAIIDVLHDRVFPDARRRNPKNPPVASPAE